MPDAPPGGARQEGGPQSPAEPPASPDPGTKKADAPAAPAEKAAPVEVPEGVKALGLPDDASQKVAAFLLEHDKAQLTKAEADLGGIQAGWKASLKTDPVVGGAQYEANLQCVKRAMARYSTEEERARYNESKLGDYPDFVRFAYRVGKDLSEDSVAGTTGSGDTASDEAKLRRLYPNSPGLFSNA